MWWYLRGQGERLGRGELLAMTKNPAVAQMYWVIGSSKGSCSNAVAVRSILPRSPLWEKRICRLAVGEGKSYSNTSYDLE